MNLSNTLIAKGINPRVLFSALDGCLSDLISEDEKMFNRFGVRPTAEDQKKADTLFQLQEILDRENEITSTRKGKIKTGLN